jgi:hypothetical protein
MDIDNLNIAIFQVLIETKSILWWFLDFTRSLYSIESFKGTGSNQDRFRFFTKLASVRPHRPK